MSRKKIVITGASGYIGSNLKNYFKNRNFEVFSFDLNNSKGKNSFQVDITDEKEVLSRVREVKPDIIIHTAGISNLAGCEKDKKTAQDINIIGTSNIIKAIGKVSPDTKLIFFSSDYVFDGARGDYKEKDKKLPKTYYGKTKLASEREIAKNLKNYIILRTANVYGRGGNFFNFIFDSLSQNKEIEVFDDVFYTPTYIDYLVDSLNILIEKDWKGIIHIVGKERVSRYEFALKMAEALGKNKKLIRPVHQSENGLIASDSSLNSDYSRSILYNFSPSLEKTLHFCFGNLINPYFYFKDGRGSLLGIFQNRRFEELNYIESKKGSERGNHYHKKTKETFFIIEGKIKVRLVDMKTGLKKEFIAEGGDIFMIRPNTAHTFYVLKDSKWINMLSKSMVEGSKDMYKLS